MQIKILAEGGKMSPGPALSQKLGPAGINMGKVISEVNEATKDFKGLKVPVVLDVDPKTKEFSVQVFSPPASELLKKEFKLEKASGIQKKLNVGNASIEQIISVAKQKMPNMLAKDLKAAVKSVIGTCTSMGILVESKPASVVGTEIDKGKYDKEINEGVTETPEEKRKQLDSFYKELRDDQDKKVKVEEKAKEAEAEKKAEKAEKAEDKKTAPAKKK